MRLLYFVLPYYSHKFLSIFKARDRFGICWSLQFQNTPYMYNLTKFWLRYLKFYFHDYLFDWEENYWDLNISCGKQLIKHPRPFAGISILRTSRFQVIGQKKIQITYCHHCILSQYFFLRCRKHLMQIAVARILSFNETCLGWHILKFVFQNVHKHV